MDRNESGKSSSSAAELWLDAAIMLYNFYCVMLYNFNCVIQIFLKPLLQQSDTSEVQKIKTSPVHSGHLCYTNTLHYLHRYFNI